MFQITATMAVGIALLSCSPRHRVVYLPPPPAYWPPPSAASLPPPRPMTYSRPPSAQYEKPNHARSETASRSDAQMVAQASPRWTALKTKKPDLEARFRVVQVKAKKIGVENLTKDDIAGLTPAQLKVLRGY